MSSCINIFYVMFWGVVSFVATFMCVLEGDWMKIINGDLLKVVFGPIFIWIAAFFVDYIYNILTFDKSTQLLDEWWTKASYFIVEVIFIILITSIYWTSPMGRTVCVASLFICMLGLKTASLYVVCPRKRVRRL